jgi:hypothetical protein
MTKPSIFISHSNRDAKWASQVESALARLGLESFSPRHAPAGDKWRTSIKAAIRKSDAVLLLIASPYAASSWMQYEAGMAEGLGKPVMVLLPKTYPIGELPADLATGQIVEFDPQAPEEAAQIIATKLAAA